MPGPWQSAQENEVSNLLAEYLNPALQGGRDPYSIRPPLPQIQMWPDRLQPHRPALSVDDIANLDDIYQRWDFSGRQSASQSSSFPALGIS